MGGTEIPWLKPWRAAISAEAGRPAVLALATVDAAGDPQVRSVVCRRIDEFGRIWITSDSRSAKHQEIQRHPRVAAVAWLPSSRVQFRFRASIETLDPADRQRIELWQTLSPETRATFFWLTPGEPRTAADDAFVRSSDAARPPESFEVLVLRPRMVELLDLNLHPHRRLRWSELEGWTAIELNP